MLPPGHRDQLASARRIRLIRVSGVMEISGGDEQDPPPRLGEPVEAAPVPPELSGFRMPLPVVLDGQAELRVGEIDPGDEPVFVEHPELGHGSTQSRTQHQQPRAGLLR